MSLSNGKKMNLGDNGRFLFSFRKLQEKVFLFYYARTQFAWTLFCWTDLFNWISDDCKAKRQMINDDTFRRLAVVDANGEWRSESETTRDVGRNRPRLAEDHFLHHQQRILRTILLLRNEKVQETTCFHLSLLRNIHQKIDALQRKSKYHALKIFSHAYARRSEPAQVRRQRRDDLLPFVHRSFLLNAGARINSGRWLHREI